MKGWCAVFLQDFMPARLLPLPWKPTLIFTGVAPYISLLTVQQDARLDALLPLTPSPHVWCA